MHASALPLAALAIAALAIGCGAGARSDDPTRGSRPLTAVVRDSAGTKVARLGREGGAPGEYRAPLALTAVGRRLVVWQDRPTSTFTVLEPDGSVLAVGSADSSTCASPTNGSTRAGKRRSRGPRRPPT